MDWKVPVSIKGIIIQDQRVLLVKNERDEWELPGGRMEKDETPEQTLLRELYEELGVQSTVIEIVDAQMFQVMPEKYVFIVSYYCEISHVEQIRISSEHTDYSWVSKEGLNQISLPDVYKQAILKVI